MKILPLPGAVYLTALLAGTTAIGTALAHDGNKVSETRDLDTFNRIVINGSADVDITAGEAQSVKVLTESDHLDLVKTDVRNNTLYISMERHRWRHTGVNLDITVQDLNGVEVEGSGDFNIRNVNSDTFDIIIDGSGDVDFSGNSTSFKIEIDGSGDIFLSGECGSLVVDVDGSGDINAENFKCETAELTLEGSGDVDVYADQSVQVDISGSGDITIYGDPGNVRPRINGSGSFEIVEETQ